MNRPLIVSLILLLVISSAGAQATQRDALVVKSPDGSAKFTLLADQPRLRFTVTMNGKTVIEPSPISFTIDGIDLAEGVTLSGRQNYAVNEEYPILGAHAHAISYCDGVRQTLKHAASGQPFTIDVRAYKDGVAFRFVAPGGDAKDRVPDEATTFTVPAGTTVWSHDLRGHYEGVYEKKDAAAIEAGTWHAPPVTLKLPGGAYAMLTEAALVNYSGMALEADGHMGFKLGLAHRHPVSHPYELRYTKEDIERLKKPAAVSGTITTPWRVVMLAADLNALVNSDLISNLNPPPDKKLFPLGARTAWVVPGRAVWRYLDNEVTPAPDARGKARPTTRPATAPGAVPLEGVAAAAVPAADAEVPAAAAPPAPVAETTAVAQASDATPTAQAAAAEAPEPATPGAGAAPATAPTTGQAATSRGATRPASTAAASRPRVTSKEMKIWSELAGKLGFEYSILEGFWSGWPPEELIDLAGWSRVQGVGVWVWVDSKRLHDPEVRKKLWKTCVDAGVVGLKVDFFDHEHKETIDLYQTILREAAENKLLLDFHGANKPTGTQRTWPNELTREAVRGMEARKLEARAAHETTLPFTRFPVGPAEYTGLLFNERRGDTTFAHQIAVPVVFTTPLMTYGAHPQKLIASTAADVIRQIPAVWDQTIALPPSEIGEIAVFARRSHDKWFLGVLNGTTPRQLKVPLTFLHDGKYTATFVRDDTTAAASPAQPASLPASSPATSPSTAAAAGEAMKVEKDLPLTKADTVTIDLPAGGGFVGCFTLKVD